MKKNLKEICHRGEGENSFSSSRDASHIGKKDWTSVFPPMESTLKQIKHFL
jgi:hypothetical protein